MDINAEFEKVVAARFFDLALERLESAEIVGDGQLTYSVSTDRVNAIDLKREIKLAVIGEWQEQGKDLTGLEL